MSFSANAYESKNKGDGNCSGVYLISYIAMGGLLEGYDYFIYGLLKVLWYLD